MSGRMAQRRAAKAARRKKLLAERRKATIAEMQLPLAQQMRRLGAAPLHSCLVQEDTFERGTSTVILTREDKEGGLVLAGFLVDVHCLGVKDVLFHRSDRAEIEDIVAAMEEKAPFTAVDPSYAQSCCVIASPMRAPSV